MCGFSASEQEFRFFDNVLLRQDSYQNYAEIVDKVKGDATLICWDVVDPITLETIEFQKVI